LIYFIFIDAKNKQEIIAISKLIDQCISMKLNVKEANYCKQRHKYITGSDFESFVKENSEFVAKEFNKLLKLELDAKSEKLAQKVFEILHDRDMLLRASKESDDKKKYPKKLLALEEDSDSESGSDSDSCNSCDEAGKNKIKGNKKEEEINFDNLDSKGFYILYLEQSKSSLYFYLALIIIGILAFTLMPVWPLELKIFIWWVTYILLIIMIGLVVVRWILYGLFLIFGKEFWLFPDLFNDNVIFL